MGGKVVYHKERKREEESEGKKTLCRKELPRCKSQGFVGHLEAETTITACRLFARMP